MSSPIFRDLGRREYLPVWEAMKAFTRERGPDTADEFWRVEHPPVFTQGQAGKPEHLLMPTEIPVIRTDRGGQITYHGPGQLVIYTLCDIRRCGLGVRGLVNAIENAIIALLADYGVVSQNRPDAPGVYVDGQKIAALGLRVSRGCSYHGLALNVDMDLSVYEAINPCGYAGLAVTQTRDLDISADIAQLADGLYQKLLTTIYRPSA